MSWLGFLKKGDKPMSEKTVRKHLYRLGYIVRKSKSEYLVIDYHINGIVQYCITWDDVKSFLADMEA